MFVVYKQRKKMTTATPIGQLKTKATAYCTICGCANHRNLSVNIYTRDAGEIEKAKAEIISKAAKSYTCRICASIKKDLRN